MREYKKRKKTGPSQPGGQAEQQPRPSGNKYSKKEVDDQATGIWYPVNKRSGYLHTETGVFNLGDSVNKRRPFDYTETPELDYDEWEDYPEEPEGHHWEDDWEEARLERQERERRNKRNRTILIIATIAVLAALLVFLTLWLLRDKEVGNGSSSASISQQAGLPGGISTSSSVASVLPSSEAPSEPESEPEPNDPPEFAQGSPAVSLKGNVVTVTYTTDVEATVNAIVTTIGGSVTTAEFYDYFNRDINNIGGVVKKATYNVTEAGKSDTITLPDLSKPYFLVINAVENETGVWQSFTTVVPLYDPGTTATGFANPPVRKAGDAYRDKIVFGVETYSQANVYYIVVPQGGDAPTPEQVKSGSGPSGILATGSVKTSGEKAPFAAEISLPNNAFGAGAYTIWVTAQSAEGRPLSPVRATDFMK